jgi:cysteine desulfuration protein SufE
MESAPVSSGIPPSVDRVLKLFRSMGREEKMQALVQYSKKLEPLPDRFNDIDLGAFNVPECQTRVDIIPEVRDGRIHFYAHLDVRQSPTIAAVLAIIFGAVNDQPPATTLGIPGDFVSVLMESIGLAAREQGLNAMISRLKRYARDAETQIAKR